MEFSSDDLLWTKNVTREKGNAWAYEEYQIGDTFYLNYSLGRNNMGIANAKTPKVNQLILLVQSMYNRILGKPGTYISHIVSPIDDKVIIDDLGTHPVKRLVTVIARDMILKPAYLDFRPNSGWIYSLDHIKPLKSISESLTFQQKQVLFWNLFKEKDTTIKAILEDFKTSNTNPFKEAIEGIEKYLFKKHKYYERNPGLIRVKKFEAQKKGSLKCEICYFDFELYYPEHGSGFIECHHKYPIAKHGVRRNRLEDLALVCANCHRMLHRKNKFNEYYTIDELQKIVPKRRL